MRRTLILIAGLALIIAGLLAPIGCSGGFLGSGSRDFIGLMSCGFTQQKSDGDLQFLPGGASIAQLGEVPGREVSFQITIVNRGTGASANIPLSSNLRIFLSLHGSPDPTAANNENSDPLGAPLAANAAPNSLRLDSNDYLVGEFVIPGLFANRFVAINNQFVIPNPQGPTGVAGRFNDDYFRVNIGGTGNLGPARIYYQVIAVLDSSNCVIENANGGANAEPSTREDQRNANAQAIASYSSTATDGNGNRFNNQAIIGRIRVVNPSLPNLKIKFLDKQPQTAISQRGGFIISTWEISNTGLGPVPQGQTHHARVFWSEDDEIDT